MYLSNWHKTPKRPPSLINNALGTMFMQLSIIVGRKKCINPTQFVYSYYHGTQHMQLRMRCRLSRFIVTLTTKKIMQGMRNYMVRVCMSEDNMRLTTIEGIWLATQRNMLKERVWQCNDLCKMQHMNMINGKYKNDMSIMTLWRYTRFDQGNKTWWVCSVSLIQEPNGKDQKVHYLVTTTEGGFM